MNSNNFYGEKRSRPAKRAASQRPAGHPSKRPRGKPLSANKPPATSTQAANKPARGSENKRPAPAKRLVKKKAAATERVQPSQSKDLHVTALLAGKEAMLKREIAALNDRHQADLAAKTTALNDSHQEELAAMREDMRKQSMAVIEERNQMEQRERERQLEMEQRERERELEQRERERQLEQRERQLEQRERQLDGERQQQREQSTEGPARSRSVMTPTTPTTPSTPSASPYSRRPFPEQHPDVDIQELTLERIALISKLSHGRADRYACLLFRYVIPVATYRSWCLNTNWDGSRGKFELPQNLKDYIMDSVMVKFPDMDRCRRKQIVDRINEALRTPREFAMDPR